MLQGNTLKDEGKAADAMRCYLTAVSLCPAFAPAHSNLASIYKEQGQWGQVRGCDGCICTGYYSLPVRYQDPRDGNAMLATRRWVHHHHRPTACHSC